MRVRLLQFANRFEIGKVLQTPARALVFDEGCTSHERHTDIIEHIFDALVPCVAERNPAHPCKDIDAVWRQSELNHFVGEREVDLSDIECLQRRTERGQRRPYTSRVVTGRIDPDTEIYGGARHTVHGKRVRSDDKETCVGPYQFGENVTEILRHRFLVGSRPYAQGCDSDGNRVAGVSGQGPARENPLRFGKTGDQADPFRRSSSCAPIGGLAVAEGNYARCHSTTISVHV